MDAGILIVLTNPNGNTQADIAVKNLVPYGGSTSFGELQDGIGIVKFLRGKDFFHYWHNWISCQRYVSFRRTRSSSVLDTILIEKILRTVPDVGKIFVLEMFVNLFLYWMMTLLISAANTTFDERYDVAMDVNTSGACHLIAYVNGQRQGRVMEKPFDMGDCIAREILISETTPRLVPELDIEEEFVLARDTKEGCHESEVAQKMKELGLERARKHGWKDTYVFTKAMGEMMINNMRGEIPVVIIRPSVIESTCREPFPGWMEGNRMMDPIVLCNVKGQQTGFLVDPNSDPIVFDELKQRQNVAEGHPNTCPINEAVQFHGRFLCPPLERRHGQNQIGNSGVLEREAVVEARSGMQEVSGAGKVLGQHIRAVHILWRKKKKTTIVRFDNSNTMRLLEKMSEEEKMSFGFDVESIEWKDYIKSVHIPGLWRHVMKGKRDVLFIY
ncbi:hypothetical protein F3Y22_tig00110930pilonHSYRG00086 [Hibiscus syriacus]|uniref:Fatty acyl-CoA reductase n=1 Tax=Hibiscus syriacus TaxID=106335 RepID=A0A6A2ZE72_HIBSY|nr:hypothetical protein F3Y22_tig00110930pilonHSYRG00086 [Hibiscus syriacus]